MRKKYKVNELESGDLKISDVHTIRYYTFGNQNGIPLLHFNGGPGGVGREIYSHFLDQNKFFIMFFDQRGCGRSTPSGEIVDNTTDDIINDVVKLLDHLKVDKLLMTGDSWGATLSMLFAERYPDRILGLVIRSLFFGETKWNNWFLKDVRTVVPKEYDELRTFIGDGNADKIFERFQTADFEKKRIMAWAIDVFLARLNKGIGPQKQYLLQDFGERGVANTKIFLHYMKHEFFLKNNQIMSNAKKLINIPIDIIHGEFDFDCTIDGAQDFHAALPNSEFHLVQYGGHGGNHGADIQYKILNMFGG